MIRRITKRTVDEAVAPAARELRIHDDAIPGFCLRVRGKRKTYFVRYSAGRRGSERWRRIGEHGQPWKPGPGGQERTLTADLARSAAMQLRGLVEAGEDPAANREIPTVEEFSARYIAEHVKPHRAEGTVRAYGWSIDNHIADAFGKRPLDDLTTADVTRWHQAMGKRPIAANRALAVLSNMYTMARKWGVLEQAHPHPCRDVPRYKERKRKRYLSPDELARLGEAMAGKTKSPQSVLVIRALLYTGARIGEIVSLEWTEVAWDAQDAGIALKVRKARGPDPQPIHLPPPLVKLLKAHRKKLDKDEKYLFPGEGREHLTRKAVEEVWWRIRAVAGLEDVRLHDLRHTFASVAVTAGKSLPMIGALLGHTQTQTTARYAHLANDPVAKAAGETADAIEAALGPKLSD